jgi:UDP-N-acetylglucosamine:LPS N-acetylglucosamine transferase
MVQAGAAVRIGDADLTGSTLVEAIRALDDARLRAMAKASKSAGRRDAAQRVLAVLREVALTPGDRRAA